MGFCLFTFIQLIFSLIFFNFTIANFSASSKLPLCHDDELSALLQFKESLIIAVNDSFEPPYGWNDQCRPKAASWKLEEGNDIDCCSWDGVECNNNTGYVIKLDLSNSCLYGSINSSSSLFNLVHLEWLNLAFNYFNSSKIPPGIINLSRLSYLNLSGLSFSGQIPSEILELPTLVSLDLSNSLLELEKPGLANLAEKLTNLKTLNLRRVLLFGSSIPHNLANLSSLTFLYLEECGVQGRIPSSLGNLSKLVFLGFSFNYLSGELPASIGNLTSLKELYLPNNILSGKLPVFIGNLTSLKGLYLSYNKLSGELPTSIGNLISLKALNLSHNRLFGKFPNSIGNLHSLEVINLSLNKFSGELPNSIGNITQLQWLILESTNFSGELPASIGNLGSMERLEIPKCNFLGRIPSSLSNLSRLSSLDLSQNNFSGRIDLDVFLVSKKLEVLDLSSNKLSLLTQATSNNTSHTFSFVLLRSCNLTEFPNFVKNQHHLWVLDLSSNRIHGKVPKWLLDPSMQSINYLNLSHNLLTGFYQHPVVLPWRNNELTLDLSSNYLEGPLPVPPPTTWNYLVSNNSLTGEIPSWICNLNNLQILDLSLNNLSGLLPKCLGNFSDWIRILDLKGNRFSGSIPQLKAVCLNVIDLSDNLLRGRIPRSLANCSELEFLALGNNQINDTFPFWLGSLSKLEVLILKSNKLHGNIREPKIDCGFPKLRIIDLSNNTFTGKLPSKYFRCWNAMKVVNANELRHMQVKITIHIGRVSEGFRYYDYSLTMSNKGQMMSYDKIPDFLTGIILSSNQFDGEIPISIADLKGLQILGLANNRLQGHIPPCLGNLTELESLDLSNNYLSGQIPQHLVDLTFLEFFNVSHNNLTGPIPQANQFLTFDNTSFDGNSGLCGKPLTKECKNSEDRVQGSESMVLGAVDWKIVLIGYSGGIIVGVVLGLSFSARIVGWFSEKLAMRSKRVRR